ncbi:hypothetical protein QJ48_12600 [Paenibacillus sp. A3]|uniref:hypothetical protein n=1 Tax=Paenibacillus sp. A3 TaxID=1337054 RepID=UPI0006D59EE3|nr:hypothetical protein [Paenibacillus sp. A3]KPV59153.1 hypothetical protein QJ48_12600 [Paenibacillus sp. A3]
MIAPIQSVIRSYQIHKQWFALEDRHRRQDDLTGKRYRGRPQKGTGQPSYSFDRFAERAAGDARTIVTAAGALKQTAENARAALQSNGASLRLVEGLVGGYNELANALSEAGVLLRPAWRKHGLGAPAEEEFDRLGVIPQADGTLSLDEHKLQTQLDGGDKHANAVLQGIDGWIMRLTQAAAALHAIPPADLLERHDAGARAFGHYTALPGKRPHSYWPVPPLTGILMNVRY